MMLELSFFEDLFIEFSNSVINGYVSADRNDLTVIVSIKRQLENGNLLTLNQSNLIKKLLLKYKNQSKKANLNYEDNFDKFVWKNSFRQIDMSKVAYLDIDGEGKIWLHLKFPFSLKNAFEKSLKFDSPSIWDQDSKTRKIGLYDCNLHEVNEFLVNNQFDLDITYQEAYSTIEEILNQESNILPCSEINDGAVRLINANEEALIYFQQYSNTSLGNQLLVSKSMGYPLRTISNKDNLIEKISHSEENYFWIKNFDLLFSSYKQIDGKIAVLLDRNTSDFKAWIESFVHAAEKNGVPKEHIKVCFRNSSDAKDNFNHWVKENSLGGSIEDGKIYIFKHKPPKWLIKNNIDIKIIVLNNITPISDMLTQSWLESHSCSLYVGGIKPTMLRKKIIVEL